MSGSILIVDQSAERAARLDATLQENGFLTSVVLSKRTARQQIAQNAPDALLIHTDLTDGCGFDLAHEINRQSNLEFAPIFLFSHRAREDDFARSFASGALELVSLPQDMPSLLRRLPPLIRGKRFMGELDLRLPAKLELGLAETPSAFDHQEPPVRVQIEAGVLEQVSDFRAFGLVETQNSHDCSFVSSWDSLGTSTHPSDPAIEPPALLISKTDNPEMTQNALHHGIRDFLTPDSNLSNIAAAARYHSKYHKSRLAKEAEIKETLRTAHLDPVTKAYSRSFAERYLDKLQQSVATRPYGLMIIDLDHFKSVNDRFGHIEGDKVLAAAVSAMSTVLREDSALFRWGGDEFLVTCPGLDPVNIATFGARLMDAIQAVILPDQSRLSGSFGAVSLGESSDFDAQDMLRAADQALYRAKAQSRGRGQVA